MRMLPFPGSRWLVVLGLLLVPVAASNAQTTYTWSGLGDANWNTPGNWVGDIVPANSESLTDILFNNTAGLVNTINTVPNGTFNIRTLTFDVGAGQFNVSPTNTNPTTLRIGTGGVVVNASNPQTITNPIALSASQTWTTGTGTGNLFIDGAVNATGHTLTFAGNNAITLSQSATVTGGSLVKNGPGTLTLSGNNTPAAVAANAGTLIVNQAGSGSPIGTAPVTLGGGTLSFRSFGNPVAASGYNHDVVSAVSEIAGGSPFGTTRAVDGTNGTGSYVYFQAGVDTANPGNGMPAGGRFQSLTNAAVTYQFQDYTGNNVLSLGGGATTDNRLTLSTPGAYRSLSIMNVTGSGSSTYSVVLNFSDATSTTFAGNASPDWFGGANPVFVVNGRMRRDNGNIENQNSGNPRIYATDLTLSAADQLKTLTSIDFLPTTGGTFNVFGLSGTAGSNNQVFTNAVTVTANSTLDQANVAAVTLGPLAIGSQTLTSTGSTGTSMTLGATTLSGSPTFAPQANASLTLGAIGDGGTARTITKAGAGTLILGTAASSAGAGTTVNLTAGTTNLAAANALGTAAAVTLSPGATLALGAPQTVRSLAGTGGAVIQNANALTINGGAAATFAGALSGGSLTVSGAGTNQTLTGAGAMTATAIQNGGRLAVASPMSLGTAAVTIQGSGTLSVGVLAANVVTGFGGTGAGWNLQGTPGAPTVTADTLTITTADNGLARTAWNATAITPGRPFTASFRYSHSNPGGADGMTFALQNASATAVGIGGGGLGYAGINPSVALAINIFGSNTPGIALTSGGIQPTVPYTAVGPVDLPNAGAGNEVVVSLNYDGTNVSGTLTQGANVFTIPSTPINISQLVGTSGFVGFTGGTGGLNSAQTVDQFSFNQPALTTYAAPVTLVEGAAATLAVAATAGLPTVTMNNLTVGPGATLAVQPETSVPANQAYAMTFAAVSLQSSSTLTVANNGTGTGTLRLNGAVTGTSGLTKAGAGRLELAGNNTGLSGPIAVSQGSLYVVNTAGSGTGTATVSVASGATFGGTGTAGGAVTVNAGATLAPGGSPGTLTLTNGVTTAAGSTLRLGVFNASTPAAANTGGSTIGTLPNPTSNNFLNVTGGTTAIDAGTQIQIDGTGTAFTLNSSYSYRVGTLAGNPSFTINNQSLFSTVGFTASSFSLVADGSGALVLNFTPVPEPATVFAIGMGLMGATGLVRRVRRRTTSA
jgi:fibronectin-binding autotransporter adhesin